MPPILDAQDLWVFRDAHVTRTSRSLREGLIVAILRARHEPEATVEALVRAGEIESVLLDRDLPATEAMAVTDALAEAVLSRQPPPTGLDEPVRHLDLPGEVRLSPPESLSYYALHPLDFEDLTRRALANVRGRVAVVGLRSVGTTLSAIALATAQRLGLSASRCTVRPTGTAAHKELAQDDRRCECLLSCRTADFVLVVDEGPGASGSSFLAVAERLMALGVPASRICLLGSRPCDTSTLQAVDVGSRFARFRFMASGHAARRPALADRALLDWRSELLPEGTPWPARWSSQERAKFIAVDGRVLKFEGLGRYGDEVRERAHALAIHGFAPALEEAGAGYVAYARLGGRAFHADPHRSPPPAVLEQLAEYLDLRARLFANDPEEPELLERAVDYNVARLSDAGSLPRSSTQLPIVRPTVCDARMLPYEFRWHEGRLFKVDGVSHGDDHLFPGPTDVAWDLAGVILEWQLDRAAIEYFLDCYRARSGDDPRPRIEAWTRAYAIMRRAQMVVASAQQSGFLPNVAA